MPDSTLTIEVPDQRDVLLEATRQDLPEILIVNEALLGFAHRDIFEWHLSIVLEAADLIENGMPAPAESELLFRIGDEIEALVLAGRTEQGAANALFLARSTWNGVRELGYYVHDPEIAHQALQTLMTSREWERQWDYRMKSDPDWEEASFILQLFAPAMEQRS